MKKLTLPAIFLSMSIFAVAYAADPVAPKPATTAQVALVPKSNGVVSPDDQKQLEAYGWIMGKQVFGGMENQFGFNDTEKEYLYNGFMKGAKGIGSSPIVVKEDGDKLEAYLEAKSAAQQKKVEAEVAKQSKASKDAAKAFFEKLDKEGKAKKTGTGLYYEILKEGSKEKPKSDSTVKIDYVGKLIDGTEFDSSKKHGQPVTFNLSGVIPGFNEGLQLIGKGGSIRLYVPSELAYKDTANLPGIPAGSTLIFDVDMLDIPADTDKAVKDTK